MSDWHASFQGRVSFRKEGKKITETLRINFVKPFNQICEFKPEEHCWLRALWLSVATAEAFWLLGNEVTLLRTAYL